MTEAASVVIKALAGEQTAALTAVTGSLNPMGQWPQPCAGLV